MTKPIDLRPDHAAIVQEVLARHLPAGVSVRVFGSRAKWMAKTFSDLDLAVKGKEKLPYKVMVELADAFEESDLPFRVDVVDWHAVAPGFQAVIDRDSLALDERSFDGWRDVALSDVCEGGGGRIQTGPFGSQLHRSDYIDHGIPVIMPTNIRGGRIQTDGIAYISESEAERLVRHRVKLGDIVFSRRGEIDKCAVITQREVGWLCGTGCLLARVNTEIADPSFVGFSVCTPDTKEWLRQNAVGLVMPNLNTGILERLPLELPNLGCQQRIVAILSSFEEKLEHNRIVKETLERQAQAIFQDWLVDFGPVRRKAAGETDAVAIMGGLTPDPVYAAELAALFPDAFGDDGLPVEWTKEPLLDQANWVNGAAYKNMHFVPKGMGLPVVKIAELKAGISDQTKFTSTDLGHKYRIDDGELLFSWSGNPDTSIDAFIWTGGEAWLNQHIFAVRGNGKMDKPTLHTMLKWLMPQFAELARNKQTTGLGHVTKDDMKRLLITKPPRPVAEAFSSFASLIFERIVANLYECRILAETRDYLLPRLMSGTVRVIRESEAA